MLNKPAPKIAPNSGAAGIPVTAVTERLTNLRVDPKSGAIAEKEIKNMENFLSKNEESLKTMYAEMGKGYEKHFDNLNSLINYSN